MRLGGIVFNDATFGTGAWKVCNAPANALPEQLATAMVAINMDLFGASYVPIRLLATQIVNGTNYMVVAKQILSDAERTTNIVLLVVNIPPYDITGQNATIVEVIDQGTLPDEVQDAFDDAIGALHGVNYTPLLYIGHSITKGINYYVLAESQVVYPGAAPKPVVVCINAFEGQYTVVSIEPVEAFDVSVQEEEEDQDTVKDNSPYLGKPLGEWP